MILPVRKYAGTHVQDRCSCSTAHSIAALSCGFVGKKGIKNIRIRIAAHSIAAPSHPRSEIERWYDS